MILPTSSANGASLMKSLTGSRTRQRQRAPGQSTTYSLGDSTSVRPEAVTTDIETYTARTADLTTGRRRSAGHLNTEDYDSDDAIVELPPDIGGYGSLDDDDLEYDPFSPLRPGQAYTASQQSYTARDPKHSSHVRQDEQRASTSFPAPTSTAGPQTTRADALSQMQMSGALSTDTAPSHLDELMRHRPASPAPPVAQSRRARWLASAASKSRSGQADGEPDDDKQDDHPRWRRHFWSILLGRQSDMRDFVTSETDSVAADPLNEPQYGHQPEEHTSRPRKRRARLRSFSKCTMS